MRRRPWRKAGHDLRRPTRGPSSVSSIARGVHAGATAKLTKGSSSSHNLTTLKPTTSSIVRTAGLTVFWVVFVALEFDSEKTMTSPSVMLVR
jgi:hypothetical protein